MPTIGLTNGNQRELRLFYRQLTCPPRSSSSRPALLLIHGAGGSSLHYLELMRRLVRTRRVVALDLPGHGKSSRYPQRVPPDQLIPHFAQTAAALAEALGLGRYIVAGHSMGGPVALQLALQNNASVAGLLLIATAARVPVSRALMELLERDFDSLPQTFAATGYSRSSDPAQVRLWAAQQLASDKAQVVADFAALQQFDCREQVARLELPAVAVVPRDDLLILPRFQRLLATQLACCELFDVERAGHFPQRERPDRVVAALERLDALVRQHSRELEALQGR